jgi:hypothetical protein
VLPGQAAHAGALGAQDQGGSTAEIGVGHGAGGLVVGADDEDVPVLQLPQGAGQVGDGEIGHRIGGAGSSLDGHRGQAGGTVLGGDDRVHAEGVGAAQAGAQVVGIGDAVQDQQQGRLGQFLQHRIQILGELDGIGQGHHALGLAPGHLLDAGALGQDQAHALVLGGLDQVLGAAVAASLIQVDDLDALRVVTQAGDDGMKAVDDLALAHA